MFDAFYVMKVSRELHRLGWNSSTLPDAMDPQFRAVIAELKQLGATPERAAEFLSEAMHNPEFATGFDDAGPHWRAFFGMD